MGKVAQKVPVRKSPTWQDSFEEVARVLKRREIHWYKFWLEEA